MNDTQEALCHELSTLIEGQTAGDILCAFAYLSGEVLAQCTDDEVDLDELRDYMNLIHRAYVFNCGYTDATIQ